MDALSSNTSNRTGRRKFQRGFTLLETIVAMTILAITLTSIMQTYLTGRKSEHLTDQYVHALVLSQSLMAETLADKQFYLKSRSGQYGLLQWRINVEPSTAKKTSPNSNHHWQLFNVEITIEWPPERRIHLKTIKLGALNG